MTTELERLADKGLIEREPPVGSEVNGLLAAGEQYLAIAADPALPALVRFTLGYDAAHSFALAALRRAGYRSPNRYLVFQCLAHTLGMGAPTWRLLSDAHLRRNRAQYEGVILFDDRHVEDVISAAGAALTALRAAMDEG